MAGVATAFSQAGMPSTDLEVSEMIPFGMSENNWNNLCDEMKCGTCGQYHFHPLTALPFDCEGRLGEKKALFESMRPAWEARLKEVNPEQYARYMEWRR